MNYWELLLTYRYPHEGFILGYELFEVSEDYSYNTVILHLGFISLDFNYE